MLIVFIISIFVINYSLKAIYDIKSASNGDPNWYLKHGYKVTYYLNNKKEK